jgi:hypothetical protein
MQIATIAILAKVDLLHSTHARTIPFALAAEHEMIRKSEAKAGVRVRWQSLDPTVPPAMGTINRVDDERAFIDCDDGEDSDTYLDSGASCWGLA